MSEFILKMNTEIALEKFNSNNQDVKPEPMSDKELESFIKSL